MSDFYVYIIANCSRMLYVGITNDLQRRMGEHRLKLARGYAARYNIKRLVYYEVFGDPTDAIGREKQMKGWLRSRKVALIESVNPEWKDLAEE